MIKPEIKSARGILRFGSRTSSLIADADSNPAKANAMFDKSSISETLPSLGLRFDRWKSVAEPNLSQASKPIIIKIAAVSQIPSNPPAL